jgi:HSP20 family protein
MQEDLIMAVSEKAKEKLDEAGKEIREAIDNLKQEVSELSKKVKDRLKGTGMEMRGSAEELTQEVRRLSEKVKDLIPRKGKQASLPVRFGKSRGIQSGNWEQPFLELRRATDRLFDDFFNSFGRPLEGMKSPLSLTKDLFMADWPLIDMDETDEEVRITAELPGVERDDIDVSVTDNRITIQGEKMAEDEKKERGYYKLERNYGSFQRSLTLPCEVISGQVDASFKNGILTIKLPKSAAAREERKKIQVRKG